ncbi:MAG TPA: non-canonical purine NTP pyrophosphatase [Candidatus Eisenbacteria bacterium]|nr:non-canonical purine NTP pyrophosphatase [Candidatus Eisenbacteria bacterium]
MLYFVTENKQKFDNAQIILKEYTLSLTQKPLPLVEIQSHSLEDIAKDKARQAFALVKKPLVVKDDGWYITALNGFPGSYMKYTNEWLTPQDFLNLLKPYTNREIIFRDALYFTDGKKETCIVNTITGRIIDSPKGKGVSSATISTFRKDGKTMAECINEGLDFADKGVSIWHEFARWYNEMKSVK